MQPDAGIHHHALHLVLAHQDAALGIIGVIAGMDADALEIRNTLQIRQPLLETGRLGDEQRIGTLGNCRSALHLLRLLARNPAQAHVHFLGLEFHALQVAPRRLQGVAEITFLRQFAGIYLIPQFGIRNSA